MRVELLAFLLPLGVIFLVRYGLAVRVGLLAAMAVISGIGKSLM